MKVLQAMAGARHGGAEAFFVRLVSALARDGLTQLVAIRRNRERAAGLRAAGVAPVQLPFGGFFDWRTRPGLRAAIGGFQPDVVLTWMNRATHLCPGGAFVHAARLGGYYNLKYYARCDHLIANTRGIADYLVRQGWPAEQVHHLPNFVDPPRGEPLARGSLDTPEDVPLLVALGRLHPNKAFDVLLSALAGMPRAHLWLAGEGPERRSLEALARELDVADRVRFLGWRDDAPALIQAADLFVCPSRHEPLGNVVIEAWAAGTPVVAAAAAGPRELIQDRKSGLLVPIDDADALRRAAEEVLREDSLARSMVAAGREAYDAAFTEPAVVRAYRGFFEQIVR
ncbi:MAG: glycosyltransferase [Acetobacterales bacterium]